MIFITAKFRVRPEQADQWPDITRGFTEATRAEPGNLWFEWSRSLDDPTEYALVEAFRDIDAGAAHVQSDHFKKRRLPRFRRACWRRLGLSARRSIRPTGPSSAKWASFEYFVEHFEPEPMAAQTCRNDWAVRRREGWAPHFEIERGN